MDNAISTPTVRAQPASFFESTFWRKTTFQIVVVACVTFVAATILAMFAYGGGTYDIPQKRGLFLLYQFL